MSEGPILFSIGHSNHPLAHFLALLQQHRIEVLADVRSMPFSRFNPQFNRGKLDSSLREAGIRYEFLGDELGARTKDPEMLEDGKVSYAKIARSTAFQHGLARLLREAGEHRVAMMCAEKEPLQCHRTLLVGREAEKAGASVTHILADGALEENRHAMERLSARTRLPQGDLFT